jgi:hypothetical protein
MSSAPAGRQPMTRRQKWLQFSLRSFLAVVAALAIFLAWIVRHAAKGRSCRCSTAKASRQTSSIASDRRYRYGRRHLPSNTGVALVLHSTFIRLRLMNPIPDRPTREAIRSIQARWHHQRIESAAN